jgi:hypothetical protein
VRLRVVVDEVFAFLLWILDRQVWDSTEHELYRPMHVIHEGLLILDCRSRESRNVFKALESWQVRRGR